MQLLFQYDNLLNLQAAAPAELDGEQKEAPSHPEEGAHCINSSKFAGQCSEGRCQNIANRSYPTFLVVMKHPWFYLFIFSPLVLHLWLCCEGAE